MRTGWTVLRCSGFGRDSGDLICPSSEIDAPLDRSKIRFGAVVRCKGPEVEFARLVQFAERILIVHRREQRAPLLERDPGPLSRKQPVDRCCECILGAGAELAHGGMGWRVLGSTKASFRQRPVEPPSALPSIDVPVRNPVCRPAGSDGDYD